MKQLKKWIWNGEKVVISKEEILNILFHRGRMLLLDSVTIDCGKAIGDFVVSREVCDGHEPSPGIHVFRGVDIIEMAFQLLGVIVYRNPGLDVAPKGMIFVAREVVSSKFNKPVFAGDHLVIETDLDVYIEEAVGVVKIESGLIIAKVEGKKVGMIHSVSIAGFQKEIKGEQT